MREFCQGETVALRAEFADGAFPDEYLVTFASVDGEVSGFVKRGHSVKEVNGSLFLTGQIQEVAGPTLTIFVRGSFFTNSGFVKIQSDQIEEVYA